MFLLFGIFWRMGITIEYTSIYILQGYSKHIANIASLDQAMEPATTYDNPLHIITRIYPAGWKSSVSSRFIRKKKSLYLSPILPQRAFAFPRAVLLPPELPRRVAHKAWTTNLRESIAAACSARNSQHCASVHCFSVFFVSFASKSMAKTIPNSAQWTTRS